MEKELKTIYFRLLGPALAAIAVIFLIRRAGFPIVSETHWSGSLGVVIFILAGSFAIALPIFFRTLFLHRIRRRERIPASELLVFERRFLYVALVPAYLAAVAYALHITYFHFVGTVLMALYAAYYYYPSSKRIALERRIFRVAPD